MYIDFVFRNVFKLNYDVFLLDDLGFYGSMFFFFDLIVEVDRIFNKRDELVEVIDVEVDGNMINLVDLFSKVVLFVNNVVDKVVNNKDNNGFVVDSRLRCFFCKCV